MSTTFDLRGRVAIVTGAGSGLGRSHALALAARGARIVANDIDAGACEKTVDVIARQGGQAAGCVADLADRDSGRAIADAALSAWGRIDVLVNNAGLLRDRTFLKQNLDDFEHIVAVHLLGSTRVTHACWPHLREQGWGRVVLTTSSSGLWGSFGQSNYAAAKMGLVGLMLALRLEGEKAGIRINTIAPFAQTRMAGETFPEAVRDRMKPEYVSALVTYLCSEACQVTGEVFEVGLGRIARVRLQRAAGRMLAEPGSPEAIAAAMPELLAEPVDRHFEHLFDDFEQFANPI